MKWKLGSIWGLLGKHPVTVYISSYSSTLASLLSIPLANRHQGVEHAEPRICKKILKDGDVQVSDREREVHMEGLWKVPRLKVYTTIIITIIIIITTINILTIIIITTIITI